MAVAVGISVGGIVVGKSVGAEVVVTAGEHAETRKTNTHPAMRVLLIGSLLLGSFSYAYSIPLSDFHPSEELSLYDEL
jgi:hypothetical protein